MDSRPSPIDRFSLIALRGALKLELRGLKRRGRSAGMLVKDRFGWKGSKESLLKQLEDHLESTEMLANRYTPRDIAD